MLCFNLECVAVLRGSYHIRCATATDLTPLLSPPETSLVVCGVLVYFLRRVRRICEKRLVSFVRSVRPSCLEQLDSHWTDFYEIWNLRMFL